MKKCLLLILFLIVVLVQFNDILAQKPNAILSAEIGESEVGTTKGPLLSAFEREAKQAGKTARSIEGSEIVNITEFYEPGSTGAVLEFSTIAESVDFEAVIYVEMVFPAGVTVVAASDMGELLYNGDLTWGIHPDDWDWEQLLFDQTVFFTVTVNIDAEFSGDMDILWTLHGHDGGEWTSPPHVVNGTATIEEIPDVYVENPTNFAAAGSGLYQIDLSWDQNGAGDNVMVAWNDVNVFGSPLEGEVYELDDEIPGGGTIIYNGNGTSHQHSGLAENTQYFYRAWSVQTTVRQPYYSSGVSTNGRTKLTPHTLPFVEDWSSGVLFTNGWVAESANWEISLVGLGDPEPVVQFGFSPLQTDYDLSLISNDINAIGESTVHASFDIDLSNFDSETAESLSFEVYDSATRGWETIQTWDNTGGSISWTSFDHDISSQAAGKMFKIRFRAYGTSTYSIESWHIDNIVILRTNPGSRELQMLAPAPVNTGSVIPTVGSHTYSQNETVSLSAYPHKGYTFDNWSIVSTREIAEPTHARTEIIMYEDYTIQSTFSGYDFDLLWDRYNYGSLAANSTYYNSTTEGEVADNFNFDSSKEISKVVVHGLASYPPGIMHSMLVRFYAPGTQPDWENPIYQEEIEAKVYYYEELSWNDEYDVYKYEIDLTPAITVSGGWISVQSMHQSFFWLCGNNGAGDSFSWQRRLNLAGDSGLVFHELDKDMKLELWGSESELVIPGGEMDLNINGNIVSHTHSEAIPYNPDPDPEDPEVPNPPEDGVEVLFIGVTLLPGDPVTFSFQTSAISGWYHTGDGWEGPEVNVDGVIELEIPYPGTRSNNVYIFLSDTPLPVELSSFTAVITADMYVNLEWRAETETDMLGYNVYRGYKDDVSDAVKVNPLVIEAHNVSQTTDYNYIDKEVMSGQDYYYWLESVDLDLTNQFHGPIFISLVEEDDEIPPVFETVLRKNYPNPFNPVTNIEYSLKEETEVSLRIYNLRGQVVKDLFTGFQQAGEHKIVWEGLDNQQKEAATGVYFYRLKTDHYDKMYKMLMVK
jgi:hypothetical protein